jgi:cell division protein FtsB
MSKKTDAHAEPPPRKRSRLHWSTVVAGLVCLPLLLLAVHLGRTWHRLSERETALDGELVTLTARNAVLQPAAELLQNQKFQICNKSTDTLTIPWVAASYHDGRQLKLFDALHCQGWRPVVIAPGGSKVFNFSSPQEGCNWNGSVALYAFRLVRDSDEGVRAYNVSGAWRGFDRDCFTVE